MEYFLIFWLEVGDDAVRIEIAQKQRHLKEEQANSPDCGGTTEPGQNRAGDNRLNLKEKESADENSESIETHSRVWGLQLDLKGISKK